MKLLFLASLAALAAFASPAAAADNFPGAPGAIALSGKCAKLVVAKFDATKGCKGELASVTLANGLVTFIFSSDGKLLGFQGDGAKIKPGKDGVASLPLLLVSTGVGNKITGEVKTTGTCTFGNPYSGKPIAIECNAKSTDAAFTGSFRTSGKKPTQK